MTKELFDGIADIEYRISSLEKGEGEKMGVGMEGTGEKSQRNPPFTIKPTLSGTEFDMIYESNLT